MNQIKISKWVLTAFVSTLAAQAFADGRTDTFAPQRRGGNPSAPANPRSARPAPAAPPARSAPTTPNRGGFTPAQPGQPNVNRGAVSPDSPLGRSMGRGNHPIASRPNGGFIENRGHHELHYRQDGSLEARVFNEGRMKVNFDSNGGFTRYEYGRETMRQNIVQVNGGSPYWERTVFRGGHPEVRHYNSYLYGHSTFFVYRPFHQFNHYDYGCLSAGWGTPLVWTWEWNSPRYRRHRMGWYGSFGYYVNPYATYSSPSYWLVDYIVSSLLESGFQTEWANDRSVRANWIGNRERVAIGFREKELLRNQVEETIRLHQRGQSLTLGSVRSHSSIFMASDYLVVSTEQDNFSCALSAGDLLQYRQFPEFGDDYALMTVVSSKGGSCPPRSSVFVRTDDLQEMLNSFSNRVESGMHQMRERRIGGGWVRNWAH